MSSYLDQKPLRGTGYQAPTPVEPEPAPEPTLEDAKADLEDAKAEVKEAKEQVQELRKQDKTD